MLRTWLLGHRKAAVGVASVAVVCASTGVVVALDGGEGPDGYVAVGAAGAAPTEPGDRVAPTGKVRLVPLDPPEADGPGGSSAAGSDPAGKGAGKAGGAGGLGDVPPAAQTPGESGAPPAAAKPPKSAAPGKDGAGDEAEAEAPSTSPSAGSGGSGGSGGSTPAGPAALKVGEPVLKKADKRWCQKVTLPLANSGGSAVRSGTATFETHVIGALGIDWATVEVTKKLPVPIGAGERVQKTWTVCVDSWRVPLGMRLETKDVDVDWK
ncbi:hypothetical protein ACFV9W_12500 [Streptomyces sp. NPDC059897]|uniref:hypothetical protein n=1 Tax=Streptomyces sp. NPDC059897 TaxID=3346994 RepID=UPI00366A0A49